MIVKKRTERWCGMDYADVYQSLKLDDMSMDELEDFGKRLSRQVMVHIGMVRYAGRVSLKKFDLTPQNIGVLMDVLSKLVLGCSKVGEYAYVEEIKHLIEYIGTLDSSVKLADSLDHSVRRSLQLNILAEMKTLRNAYRNRIGFWNL